MIRIAPLQTTLVHNRDIASYIGQVPSVHLHHGCRKFSVAHAVVMLVQCKSGVVGEIRLLGARGETRDVAIG